MWKNEAKQNEKRTNIFFFSAPCFQPRALLVYFLFDVYLVIHHSLTLCDMSLSRIHIICTLADCEHQ